ncbi:MAG: AmmeMemoRadiSam system radical SAM enzyme [Parcubacteria group bacterium]
MKQTLFYARTANKVVQCRACCHFCVIADKKFGMCKAKKNVGGRLYSLNYGKLIARRIDPIEKKPLYHFLPGSFAYSIASPGCNFHCLNCQNSEISQIGKAGDRLPGVLARSGDVALAALHSDCRSIAYTYTEPTVFVEFALEIMKLARKRGLKNVWVSNGYFSNETFNAILPHLDAINIDLKFFTDKCYRKVCGASLKPILENIERVCRSKIHVEITTLVIPGLNDNERELGCIAEFIAGLNLNIPWHISAFHPAYRLRALPSTPAESLDLACQIGKSAGLHYVYAGNAVDPIKQNTYCQACGELLIKRDGYAISNKLAEPFCPKCGAAIAIIL